MKKQTLVLDINELYKVIPETTSLEGTNFKDIRELLKDLITAIEKSGKWEFIQHIQNKPSLFVIREVESVSNDEVSKSQFKKLENRLNTISGILSSLSSTNENIGSIVKDLDKVTETTSSIYDDPFYNKSEVEVIGMEEASITVVEKLPWE